MGILQARILKWVVTPSSRGIFPNQGLNPGLLHRRQILYHLSHPVHKSDHSFHNLQHLRTLNCSLDKVGVSFSINSSINFAPFMSLQPSFSIHCCCSVTKSCPTLWDLMVYSTSDFPVLHHLPEFAQTHVHWVSDAIQPSHSLLSSSPPVFNLPQHQGLFKWVSSSHLVANVLELQLQHQSFQWIFRVDFL